MNDMDRYDDDELVRRLRAYAGARLSPDQWASLRMRAAVIEHGREERAGAAAARRGRGRWLAWRPALLVALVAILAVGTGTTAALAASPGGPLYGARVWVEGTIVSLTGNSAAAQAALVDQRLGEAADAASAGNEAGADAALDALGSEVSQAIADAAQSSAALEHLQGVITRRLDHLQALKPANSRASTQISKTIDRTQAMLDAVNAKLQALAPSPSP
jgi:hypothetical protein